MCNCKNEMKPLEYTIVSITRYTKYEWNFRIACDLDVHYGQFVQLSLPLVGEAPISVSDFGDGYIDLLIRHVGKVTSAIFAQKEGDSVWIRGPYGNGYPIAAYENKHLLIIAGGTGVAPVKGVINHFYHHPEKVRSLGMILGFKNEACVLYQPKLHQWHQLHHLIVTLDEASPDPFYQTGVVTDHINKLDLSDMHNIAVIVVGPPIMLKFTVKDLLNRGLNENQIWVDYERRMACAVGKCGHCRIGDKYVCTDGPIFQFDQAQFLID